MADKAETFFSEQEKTAISEAVKAVELRTSGEVAVMVVDESDSYPEGRTMAALWSGSLTSLALVDFFFDDSLWIFLASSLLLSLIFSLICRVFPPLKRLFIKTSRLDEMVSKRAEQAFYERGLYRTRDNTGVLIFLSLFERKVWVLADQGIYRKISQKELQGYAAKISEGIKEGRGTAVICEMIQALGSILARHFPVRDDDENELSDQVIIN